MRVALVHDWLVSYRGGEKVLEALCELYPDAPIYTLFYSPDSMPESLRRRHIITPSGSRFLKPLRKALLPFLPIMIESLPLERYDLVVSTSSCVAKGVIVGPTSRHICYIHSPMRYIWDQRSHYLGRLQNLPILSQIYAAVSSYLRIWDSTSNQRVDRFVANSRFVAQRVLRYYGCDAGIVHPPVELESFMSPRPPPPGQDAPYFLAAGAMVSYKRFDLAIEACRLADKRLVIAGTGPEFKKLQNLADSKVSFIHNPDHETWTSLFQHAQALLFPGVEDFGITALEAMAAGTPVIAYKAGGALDFIEADRTGKFFNEPSPESLARCLQAFQKAQFNPSELQSFARGFTKELFLRKMRREIAQLLEVSS